MGRLRSRSRCLEQNLEVIINNLTKIEHKLGEENERLDKWDAWWEKNKIDEENDDVKSEPASEVLPISDDDVKSEPASEVVPIQNDDVKSEAVGESEADYDIPSHLRDAHPA